MTYLKIKGCDLRNIERVILWDLPPTFCSLVQRIGRAARDLSKQGEAILLVRKGVRKAGLSSTEVQSLQTQINGEEEALNMDDEELDRIRRMEMENVVEGSGHEIRHLDEGGMRVEEGGENEEVMDGSDAPKSHKKTKTPIEIHESSFLTLYANTSVCLRKIWNAYFNNEKKSK